MLPVNEIYFGDCLDWMKLIDDKSIDMILCDLPYGTTQNKWDSQINLISLWMQYKRIIKDNGCIALFADEPFTSILITSNLKMFKYRWIWEKSQAIGHLNAYKMPMKNTEDICIFYKKLPCYNYRLENKNPKNIRLETTLRKNTQCYGKHDKKSKRKIPLDKTLPKTIIKFNNCQENLHPTQKPIELCEYFILTYTYENDLVLDNCIGSGTTAIACLNTGCNYIGIELDENYYNITLNRISQWKKDHNANN